MKRQFGLPLPLRHRKWASLKTVAFTKHVNALLTRAAGPQREEIQ